MIDRGKTMAKSSRGKGILYVRAASLEDLCRGCSNLDFTAGSLFMQKNEKRSMLLAFGEAIGDTVIAYYIENEPKTNLIKYILPDSEHERERASFVSGAEEQPSHYLNIIGVSLDGFRNTKNLKKTDLNVVRMGDDLSIINAVIKRSVRNEAIMHIYSFTYRGKLILCGFDLIDELIDDTKTFYYAVSKNRVITSFARYDYINNKVDFTNTIGEHSYMYTKIINLAEPFPFFKMPE